MPTVSWPRAEASAPAALTGAFPAILVFPEGAPPPSLIDFLPGMECVCVCKLPNLHPGQGRPFALERP